MIKYKAKLLALLKNDSYYVNRLELEGLTGVFEEEIERVNGNVSGKFTFDETPKHYRDTITLHSAMVRNFTDQEVEKYMKMPYTRELIPDDGGWFISIKELPGCMSQGDTVQEAMQMIEDAMRGWITIELEMGDEIPLPETLE